MAEKRFIETTGGKITAAAAIALASLGIGSALKSCSGERKPNNTQIIQIIEQNLDVRVQNSFNHIEESKPIVQPTPVVPAKPIVQPTPEPQEPVIDMSSFWGFYDTGIKPFDTYKGDLDILFVHYNTEGVKTQRLLEDLNFEGYMALISYGENLHNRRNREIGNFGTLAVEIDGHDYLVFNPSITGGEASYANLSNNIEAIATRETTKRVNRRNGKEEFTYSEPQGARVTIDARDYIDEELHARESLSDLYSVEHALERAMRDNKPIIAYISAPDSTTQTAIVEQGHIPQSTYASQVGGDITLLLGEDDSLLTEYFGRARSGNNDETDELTPTEPTWKPDPTDRNKLTDEQESGPNNYNDISGPASYDSTQDVGSFPGGRP